LSLRRLEEPMALTGHSEVGSHHKGGSGVQLILEHPGSAEPCWTFCKSVLIV
jgi:hypothetical protein